MLYGPRGNGKTTLLGWLEEEVSSGNAKRTGGALEIETLWFTPGEMTTVADFASQIAPSSRKERLGITKVGVPGVVQVDLRAGTHAPARWLSEALAARVREKPLLFLLDEAHNLDPEVGGALLNASQQVGRKAPFLMVLAGTPNLRWRLSRTSASFWSRSLQLPIGRLSEAGARDAVRVPLNRAGIAIADDALETIVDASRCYPFFLQLWGAAVWRTRNSVGGEPRPVELKDVQACSEDLNRRANTYYLERYEELAERDLLPAAWAVADAFGAGPPPRRSAESLGDSGIKAAIGRGIGAGDAAAIREATETLFQLGYIWRSRGEPDWEPGIPSLMDYLWERVPAEEHPSAAR